MKVQEIIYFSIRLVNEKLAVSRGKIIGVVQKRA